MHAPDVARKATQNHIVIDTSVNMHPCRPGHASTARQSSHQPTSEVSPITVVGYVTSAPPSSPACIGHPLLLVMVRRYLCTHTAGWFVHACTYDTTTGTIVNFVEDSPRLLVPDIYGNIFVLRVFGSAVLK
jgi:hypothetical protein